MRNETRTWNLAAIAVAALSAGCTMMQSPTNPALLSWDDSVELIGPVSFCQGEPCRGTDEGAQPPLSLAQPPEAPTYYSALQQKASSVYRVPVEQVVLSEVIITLSTEAVGTVRGWKADANAGRRRPKEESKPERKPAQPPPVDSQSSIKNRLRQLQELRDEGLISDDEYGSRRRSILDEL
jgi:hypothetical protein